MDRLEAMQLFVRVAELGSFAAVAQQLERGALGGHAPDRGAGSPPRREADGAQHAPLSLTSAGTAYLEKCRVILNLVEAAETDIARAAWTPRGPIRIGRR
jgi:DNA-binding transcriptional LysR family regulator